MVEQIIRGDRHLLVTVKWKWNMFNTTILSPSRRLRRKGGIKLQCPIYMVNKALLYVAYTNVHVYLHLYEYSGVCQSIVDCQEKIRHIH